MTLSRCTAACHNWQRIHLHEHKQGGYGVVCVCVSVGKIGEGGLWIHIVYIL